MEIKKVIKRLYEFNLNNASLPENSEILVTEAMDEFSLALRKIDTAGGIIVQPSGYKKGLLYLKATKELLNEPSWSPQIVKFNLEIVGLKKGAYYRLTTIARNYKKYLRIVDSTDDRQLYAITNNNDMLIKSDLTNIMSPTEFSGIFKAYSNECSIAFKFGKIAIQNIIIDEIELITDSMNEQGNEVIVDENRSQVIATSVFSMSAETSNEFKGKWIPLLKLYGKGINLYKNRDTNEYSIERDNINDVIGDNLNANYIMIDINTNKIPNIGFNGIRIKSCESDLSLNTLKSGYIIFDFVGSHGESIKVDKGKISIKIDRLI